MGSVVFTDNYSTSIAGNATYNVRIGFSEVYTASTNTTVVTITSVELQKVGNGTNWGYLPFFGSIAVNGTTLLSMEGGSSVRVSVDGSGYNSVAIPASGSVAIVHEADGSKSVTFALTGGFIINGWNCFGARYSDNNGFGVESTSKSVALTTRPRISSVTATNANFGSASTITISRYNNSFTHTVTTSCAGYSETLMTKGSSTSLSWTPAIATYAPRITNAMSATATITCQTYNGNTLIGSSTTTCTLTLTAASVAPTVSIATSDPTGLAPSYDNKYIKTKSKVKVTLTTSLKHGATLASTAITANGANYNASPATTDFISSTNNTSVTARITDSRGQSATASSSIQIYDYEAAKINSCSAYRCNQDGTQNNAGAFFRIAYNVAITALGNHNTKSLTVKYKKRADSSYTSAAVTLSSYSQSGTSQSIAADVNSTYDLQIVLADAFGSATYVLSLPTAATRMNWRAGQNGGIAIGKVSEYDKTLEIADGWAVKSKGIVDLIYPVGSIYLSTNSTSPATLFGGTWDQIQDTFLLAAGQTYAAGATGGEATHQLVASEIPAHTHGNKSLTGSLTRAVLDDGGSITRSGIVSSIDSPRTSTWKSEGGTACYRVNFNASHEHSSVGGNGAHNNMPPYLAVYVWKRTA